MPYLINNIILSKLTCPNLASEVTVYTPHSATSSGLSEGGVRRQHAAHTATSTPHNVALINNYNFYISIQFDNITILLHVYNFVRYKLRPKISAISNRYKMTY